MVCEIPTRMNQLRQASLMSWTTYKRLWLATNGFALGGRDVQVSWHFDVGTELLLAGLWVFVDLHATVASWL